MKYGQKEPMHGKDAYRLSSADRLSSSGMMDALAARGADISEVCELARKLERELAERTKELDVTYRRYKAAVAQSKEKP